MIIIVTSPVGHSGVTFSAVLLALWLRETAPAVRLIDMSPSHEESPLGRLGDVPGLHIVRAGSGASTADAAPAERRFAVAWSRAQRALESADSTMPTVVDLPHIFASWAWRDIRGWLEGGGVPGLRVMLVLPPADKSVKCMDLMSEKVAPALVLGFPGYYPGPQDVLVEAESRERLVTAGAKQVAIPSLAWGSAADACSHGTIPVGQHAPSSIFARDFVRWGLFRLANGASQIWPQPHSDAAASFAFRWSQPLLAQPAT